MEAVWAPGEVLEHGEHWVLLFMQTTPPTQALRGAPHTRRVPVLALDKGRAPEFPQVYLELWKRFDRILTRVGRPRPHIHARPGTKGAITTRRMTASRFALPQSTFTATSRRASDAATVSRPGSRSGVNAIGDYAARIWPSGAAE